MLNPIMFKDFILVDMEENETRIKNEEYTCVLNSPWRNSETGKGSFILKSKKGNNAYFLTSNICFNGKKLLDNPYHPKIEVTEFMIKKTGTVKLDSGKELPYYWAEVIKEKSLNEEGINEQQEFLNKYYKTQKKSAFLSGNYLNEFNKLLRNKESNRKNIETITQIKENLFKNTPECLCAFSHGDLWYKDVFKNNIIIDWEWSTNCAPLGTDCLDFLFYMDEEKNVEILRKTLKNEETIFSKYLLEDDTKKIVIKFFIYRYLAKFIVQDGLTAQSNPVFNNLYELGVNIND